MASKNVIAKGTTYNGVESITLSTSPSGTATFYEISDTTAVASDVASGKYFYDALGVLTQGTASGGGGGLVYETGTWTPTENVARPTISFSNAHTEPPAIVEMTDVSSSSTISTYSNVSMIYYDVYKLHGSGYPYGTSSTYYGLSQYTYVASSVSSLSGSRTFITETSDYPDDSSVYYPRYWVTETEFHPYTNSTSRYWRAGRTYKWIAVWAPTT